MTAPPVWSLVDREGGPAALFDLSWFEALGGRRVIARLHPTGSAVVLGSSQQHDIVDLDRAGRDGVEIVRRRSGGGAVWLDGSLDWFDVVLPPGDSLVEADVNRAFHWLGDVFADALAESLDNRVPVGSPGDPVPGDPVPGDRVPGDRPAGPADGGIGRVRLEVHRGPLARDPLNKLICFAGLGPGEVTLAGRKVVGISQRRTRGYTLFQCGILRTWEPAPLVGLLRPGLSAEGITGPEPESVARLVSALTDRCVGVADAADRVAQRLLDRLRQL